MPIQMAPVSNPSDPAELSGNSFLPDLVSACLFASVPADSNPPAKGVPTGNAPIIAPAVSGMRVGPRACSSLRKGNAATAAESARRNTNSFGGETAEKAEQAVAAVADTPGHAVDG